MTPAPPVLGDCRFKLTPNLARGPIRNRAAARAPVTTLAQQ